MGNNSDQTVVIFHRTVSMKL